MLYILIEIWLIQCVHLSKLSKCSLQICAFHCWYIVSKTIPQPKPNNDL